MITVVGSSTLDILVSGLDAMPEREGDEFTTSNLVFTDSPARHLLGGNGANTAFCLGQLGRETALSSAVGSDEPGRMLLGWLDGAGVVTDHVVRSSDRATSTTTVLFDPAGHRLSFHHHGATGGFTVADVPDRLLADSRALLITGIPLLSGWRMDGVRSALEDARAAGTLTAVDWGPAIGDPVTLTEMRPALPEVDVLFTNRHELTVATGREQVGSALQDLHEAGAATVIVKRGPSGALLSTSGEGVPRSPSSFSPPDPGSEPIVRVPGHGIDVEHTVGAGDSFNAAYLHALLDGETPSDALRFADAYAARIVSEGCGTLSAEAIGRADPGRPDRVART